MSSGISQNSTEEHFHSSPQSHLGKARRWMWWSLPLILAVPVITVQGNLRSILTMVGVAGIACLLIDIFIRNKLAPGQSLVGLDDEGLSSRLLPGSAKRIVWSDIVAVSLTTNQGARQIQFELAETPTRPNRRNFWNGTNPTRPGLLLTPFDEVTQTALLHAIQRRLSDKSPAVAAATEPLAGELAEEKEFQEKLKALAPLPWLTWLLIAINILVWFATLASGGTLAGTTSDKLLAWGGNTASAVQAGEWWRLLSATFLHSGLMHLAMNMIGLAAAGITVERIYGQRLYAIIYLGSALIGSALSLHFSAQKAVSVGASGAVFGITGALLVAFIQHHDKLPKTLGKQTISSLGFFIAYALLQGFSKPGIDNAAHIGGLLGGSLLAFLLPERFDAAHFALTVRNRAIMAMALALGVSSAIATLAPRATVDLQQAVASRNQFARAMESFVTAINTVQEEGKTYDEIEQDKRSRSVHAPIFRRLLTQFDQITLPENDPAQPLLQDTRRAIALMLELLEMPSAIAAESGKPQPADPARVAIIDSELKAISERIQSFASRQQAKQQQR